jgi:hypothetical protein
MAATLLVTACEPLFTDVDTPTDSNLADKASSGLTTVRVTASLPADRLARIAPEDVDHVVVQISWAGGQTPLLQMTQTDTAQFELLVSEIPASIECEVSAQALDADDAVLYEAVANAVVFDPDTETPLALNMVAADNGAYEGYAPRIIAIRRPATTVQTGSLVDMEFTVGDQDSTQLNYTLSSPSGGSFDTATGQVPLIDGSATFHVSYQAPASAGPAPITISVVDSSELSADFSFTLSIADEEVDTTPTQSHISVNFPPVIEDVIAKAEAGGIQLMAVAADDGPGSELSYLWTREGTTIGETSSVSVEPDRGIYKVTLRVTDGQQASSSLSFELNTTSTQVWHLPVDNQAPVINTSIQSRDDVSYGDVVELAVYAEDADGEALTAEWTTDKGTVDTFASHVEGTQTVFTARWHAATTAGTALTIVKVKDARYAWVKHAFVIHQVLGRVAITANAGLDRQGLVGGTVVLNATASTSEDGQIVSYLWQQISGPTSVIESPTAAVTTVRLSSPGTCRYRLTVTNINNQASDEVLVTVTDPLAFMFEDAFMTDAGIIHFLNKVDRRIHRYDLTAGQWLPPFETAADLRVMAVAPEGNQIYAGYESGRMDVIDTTTGLRSFFANAPSAVLTMAVTDGYVFTIDASGSWETFSLYSRTTGARTASKDWQNYSNGWAYSRTLHRLFTFRDGTSPNDIYRTDINVSTGTFGTISESPYHGDYSFVHPIRLFPDETRVAVASGVIFSTSDLKYVASLGMTYLDMTFFGNLPIVAKKIGTNTELTIMNPDFSIREVRSCTGEPLRVFCKDDNIVLITKAGTRLIGLQSVAAPD